MAEGRSKAAIARQFVVSEAAVGTEIKSIVEKLADIARVLANADPAGTAEIFGQLGLS